MLGNMLNIAGNAKYILLAVIITVAVAKSKNSYCRLCQPANSSGDRANHTMCLYQVSYSLLSSLRMD
jgi:hypothetical protein